MGKGAGEIDGMLQLAGGILVGGLALYRLGVSSSLPDQKPTEPRKIARTLNREGPAWASELEPKSEVNEVETDSWKSTKIGYKTDAVHEESKSSVSTDSESDEEVVPSWMSSKEPQLSVHELPVKAAVGKGHSAAVSSQGSRDIQCASKSVSTVSTTLSDILFVYPCGSERYLGDAVDADHAHNGDGYHVKVHTMESRTGAGAAVVGALSAGSKATVLTSSTNLKAMIPTLFEMTAERLPAVFHVASVRVDKELAIRQDHSDVMAVRDTGAVMISSSNAQEVHDMAVFAHVIAQETSLPTVHFFDASRGLSQLSKVKTASCDLIHGFATKHQVKDSWSSVSIAAGIESESTSSLTAKSISRTLDEMNSVFGTHYKIFEYIGSDDADCVIVAMGSAADVVAEEIAGSTRVGLIKVRLLRPWSAYHFLAALPASLRRVTILDQSGSKLSPLFQEVVASFHAGSQRMIPRIIGAKLDSASPGFGPGDAHALVSNIVSERLQSNFVVGHMSTISKPVAYKQIVAFGASADNHILNSSSKMLAVHIANGARVNAQQFSVEDTFNNMVRSELRVSPDDVVLPESYSVVDADVVVVFRDALNKSVASAAHQLKDRGTLIVASGDSIPEDVRAQLDHKAIKLLQLDSVQIITEIVGPELASDAYLVACGSVWVGLAAALYVAKGEELFSKLLVHLKNAVRESLLEAGACNRVVQIVCLALARVGSQLQQASTKIESLSFGTPLSIYKKRVTPEMESNDFDFDTRSFSSLQSFGASPISSSFRKELSPDSVMFTPRFVVKKASQGMNLGTIGRGRGNKDSSADQIVQLPAHHVAFPLIFPDAYTQSKALRPSAHGVHLVRLTKRSRLTPEEYSRNIFHLEFDISGTSLKYEIGDALGVYGHNDEVQVNSFIEKYGLDPNALIAVPSRGQMSSGQTEIVSARNLLVQHLDLFGRPSKKFYIALAGFASTRYEHLQLMHTGTDDTEAFKLGIHETITYADLLLHYTSAKLSITDLVALIPTVKPRHYSIASSMKLNPRSVHLLVVAVDWTTPLGKVRTGQCTRYLANLDPLAGDCYVAVDVVTSVMRLPPSPEQPVVMAGLGTGMAPFRAFIQERKYQKEMGIDVGPMALYFGARHRHEEYLYGDELDAYEKEGLITRLGLAFSRDQKEKVYIQHKIEADGPILKKYLGENKGHFYLCGPTWPVPDVRDAIAKGLNPEKAAQGDIDVSTIEELKKEGRYTLEVY